MKTTVSRLILVSLAFGVLGTGWAFTEEHNISPENNFQVSVFNGNGKCAGSLISEDIVLTARHCVDNADTDDVTIRKDNITYAVEEINIFDTESTETPDNDLALLTLVSAVVADVNYLKIPNSEEEEAAFFNSRPLTIFGYYGSPWNDVYGYANKYLKLVGDSEPMDILPRSVCPEGPNNGNYFCTIFPDDTYDYPVRSGDSGGAVTYQDGDDYFVLGVVSSKNYYPRLGVRRDWFSRIVDRPKSWGENDNLGSVGDIYQYDNPYNGEREYFRLHRLGGDGRYWYFPTDKSNNYYWIYLGAELDQAFQANELISSKNQWGENDRRANIGDEFVHYNTSTNRLQFFVLSALGSDGRYWYFPGDGEDNYYWQYDGTLEFQ